MVCVCVCWYILSSCHFFASMRMPLSHMYSSATLQLITHLYSLCSSASCLVRNSRRFRYFKWSGNQKKLQYACIVFQLLQSAEYMYGRKNIKTSMHLQKHFAPKPPIFPFSLHTFFPHLLYNSVDRTPEENIVFAYVQLVHFVGVNGMNEV